MRYGVNYPKPKILRLFAMMLAGLFVISVGFHNHSFSLTHDASAKVTNASLTDGHAPSVCSACLMHGKLHPPDIDKQTCDNILGDCLGSQSSEFVVLHSFNKANYPSRAPPQA